MMAAIKETLERIRRNLHLGLDYRRTFRSDHGKRVLADLMRANCMTFSTMRLDGQRRVDRDAMLIAEGRRQVILGIFARMRGPTTAEERLLRQELEGDSYETVDLDG